MVGIVSVGAVVIDGDERAIGEGVLVVDVAGRAIHRDDGETGIGAGVRIAVVAEQAGAYGRSCHRRGLGCGDAVGLRDGRPVDREVQGLGRDAAMVVANRHGERIDRVAAGRRRVDRRSVIGDIAVGPVIADGQVAISSGVVGKRVVDGRAVDLEGLQCIAIAVAVAGERARPRSPSRARVRAAFGNALVLGDNGRRAVQGEGERLVGRAAMAVAHRIGKAVRQMRAGRRTVDRRHVAGCVAVGVVAVDRQRAVGSGLGRTNRAAGNRCHRQGVAVGVRVARPNRPRRGPLHNIHAMRRHHRRAVDAEA